MLKPRLSKGDFTVDFKDLKVAVQNVLMQKQNKTNPWN